MDSLSNHYAEHVAKAVGALALNTFAIITSFQEQVEWWLRVSSLVVAIAYTSFMLIRAWRKR